MKYANQRNFTINREIPTKNTHETYLTIYCRNLNAAMRDLSGVAFKLYCYLCSNKDRYSFDFSTQDFMNVSGAGSTSAREAVNTLISKGYLIETKHNCFDFYEAPIAAASTSPSPSSNNSKTEEATTTQTNTETKPTISENSAAAPTGKRIFTHKTTGEKKTFTYQDVLELSNYNQALALERWSTGKPVDDFEF